MPGYSEPIRAHEAGDPYSLAAPSDYMQPLGPVSLGRCIEAMIHCGPLRAHVLCSPRWKFCSAGWCSCRYVCRRWPGRTSCVWLIYQALQLALCSPDVALCPVSPCFSLFSPSPSSVPSTSLKQRRMEIHTPASPPITKSTSPRAVGSDVAMAFLFHLWALNSRPPFFLATAEEKGESGYVYSPGEHSAVGC